LAWRTKAALDIGRHQIAISSVVQIEGEVLDRLQRSASGSIAITALQKLLLRDGRQQLRTGQLHQFLFERRNPSWPFRAVCLGNVTASDQFGPVAWGGTDTDPETGVACQLVLCGLYPAGRWAQVHPVRQCPA
jgi:hypothetical protein